MLNKNSFSNEISARLPFGGLVLFYTFMAENKIEFDD